MKTPLVLVAAVISLASCASYTANPQHPSLGEQFANGFMFGLGGGAMMMRPARQPVRRPAICNVDRTSYGSSTITCY